MICGMGEGKCTVVLAAMDFSLRDSLCMVAGLVMVAGGWMV